MDVPALNPAAAPHPAVPSLELTYADTRWLRELTWGALGLSSALIFQLAALGLEGTALATLLHTAALAALAAAAWFTTTPQYAIEPPSERIWRISLRIALSCVTVGWVVAILWRRPGALIPFYIGSAITAQALACHLADRCRRLDAPELRAQFLKMLWIVPAALVALIAYEGYHLAAFFNWYFFLGFPLAGGLIGVALWVAALAARLAWTAHSTAKRLA